MSQRGLGTPHVRTWLGTRSTAGESEAEDRSLHHPQLLAEGSAVVGQAIALADLFHLRGDLRVAGAGQIREEVVLDLVAEVAAGDVEQGAALDVRRSGQLAHVPTAATLVFDLLGAEGIGLVGEV